MTTRQSTEADAVNRTRVLIVDDRDDARRTYTRILSHAGHDVHAVDSGSGAIEAIEKQHFDVVLSDVVMPEMSGIELLRKVRERELDLPVVFFTGSPTVSTAAQAVSYGAFAYLTKPVDSKALVDEVARAIRLHRVARTKREAFALLGAEKALASDRAGLEASFASAMESLWMAYQPIISPGTRELFGYEALLRSAEPALPHPGAVLDAAEKLDALTVLGRKIRGAAALGFSSAEASASLFINLHPRDLLDEELYSAESPLAKIATRVVLEVTERSSIGGMKDVQARVARLRAMGFRIAIDDLGAGYAGLTSFAQLEPEIVKIDMSLVRDIDKSPTKQKLVRSLVMLCKEMGMLVVAEGVETLAERDKLVELQCDLLQGYLFAKPGRAFPPWTWGS